jgi:hypothetical protein
MRMYELVGSNGTANADRPTGQVWTLDEGDLERDWLLAGESGQPGDAEIDSRAADEVRELFDELASTWKLETSIQSFMPQKALHWAYQRIIGLGPMALPLILERLRDQGPDHWFWALAMITGEDPAADTTTLQEATEAWLSWGRDCCLI